MRDRLVLVVGAHRSGTTWFQHMLMGHPRMGGRDLVETWIFQSLRSLWSNVTGNDRLGVVLSRSDARTPLRAFCDDAFRGVLAEQPGADHFLEKTPAHSWCLDLIADLYPDAWVVHLIRDGRDVVQSAVEVEFGSTSVDTAASTWHDTVRKVRADSERFTRYREVRYESLVADPIGGVSDVLGWIGLEADAEVREEIARRSRDRVSVWGTTGAVGLGKWSRLDPDDRTIVYERAGRLLVELGYIDEAEPTAWLE